MNEENKKIPENKEKIVEDKYSGKASYSGDQLNDELEKLAETFRQELKKAQEMSDEEFVERFIDEQGVIEEDELCACCGERRRDKTFGEHYEYCAECRETMKKYPLTIQGVIMAIVFVGLSIFSIISFTNDFKAYDYGYKAEKYRAEKKLTSAITNYDYCITAFRESEINPQKMYLNCIDLVFKTMESGVNSMSFITQLVEDCVSDKQSESPLYGSTMELYNENKLLLATMQEFYTITQDEKFADYDFKNREMYEEIMAELEGIIGKEVSIVSKDGKTTDMVKSSEAMVRFCQYMFAYSSGEYEESLQYMRLVRQLKPEYYWLYGYQLGMAELQNGNAEESRALAKEMLAENVENPDSYLLNSAVDRMTGKYKNSISWCDKGLENVPESNELYRYKAMAYVASGDLEKAEEAIEAALEMDNYALGYMTAIVIENELGRTDVVKELTETLEDEEVELTEKMKNYLNGKITAKQMFTEGTGDVE